MHHDRRFVVPDERGSGDRRTPDGRCRHHGHHDTDNDIDAPIDIDDHTDTDIDEHLDDDDHDHAATGRRIRLPAR